MRALRRRGVIAATILASLLAAAPAVSAPSTPPSPTSSPAVAAPSPAPSPTAASEVVISGQLIDMERGYAVLSTGDAFRTTPRTAVVDAVTRAPIAYAIEPGLYAALHIDTATATVTTVDVSHVPLREGIPASAVPRELVSAASPPQPNPELAPPPVTYHSQLSTTVLVTIDVEVPPETPYTDDVYIATDSSGWNAQAIKMQRIDGRRFRIQIDLKPGTQFHYLFTRGSWQTVERDRSGLKRPARQLSVLGGDSMVVSLDVYRWADIQ